MLDEVNTETAVIVNPNFVMDAVLNDKLEYTNATLLSNSQNKLIKTLKKEKHEKQR